MESSDRLSRHLRAALAAAWKIPLYRVQGFQAYWKSANRPLHASISQHGLDFATVTNRPKSQWFNTTTLYFSITPRVSLGWQDSVPCRHSGTRLLEAPLAGSFTIWNVRPPHLLQLGKTEKRIPSLKHSASSMIPTNSKRSGKCGFPRVQEGEPGFGEHQQCRPQCHQYLHQSHNPVSWGGHCACTGDIHKPAVALKDLLFLSFFSTTKQNISYPCGAREHTLRWFKDTTVLRQLALCKIKECCHLEGPPGLLRLKFYWGQLRT